MCILEQLKLETHITHVIIRDLVDLDVVPLLSSLQRLQVVTRRVIVDQFSSPLGNFLLHVRKYRRCTHSYLCVECLCGVVSFCVSALRPFFWLCSELCLLACLLPLALP